MAPTTWPGVPGIDMPGMPDPEQSSVPGRVLVALLRQQGGVVRIPADTMRRLHNQPLPRLMVQESPGDGTVVVYLKGEWAGQR
jgi:hypothetical protein